MTEKRFTVEPTMIRECIVDNTTGEQLDTFDYTERLCEVLNELNEENQKLLRDCDNLIDDNTELVVESNQDNKKLKEVLEENEQLKQAISDWKGSYDELYSDNKILEKENEQLKQSLERKQRRIDAYEDYIKTLKEDGVLND